MGKSSISRPFSMAMLNNQRVYMDTIQTSIATTSPIFPCPLIQSPRLSRWSPHRENNAKKWDSRQSSSWQTSMTLNEQVVYECLYLYHIIKRYSVVSMNLMLIIDGEYTNCIITDLKLCQHSFKMRPEIIPGPIRNRFAGKGIHISLTKSGTSSPQHLEVTQEPHHFMILYIIGQVTLVTSTTLQRLQRMPPSYELVIPVIRNPTNTTIYSPSPQEPIHWNYTYHIHIGLCLTNPKKNWRYSHWTNWSQKLLKFSRCHGATVF